MGNKLSENICYTFSGKLFFIISPDILFRQFWEIVILDYSIFALFSGFKRVMKQSVIKHLLQIE
jgi:hypothetical protein